MFLQKILMAARILNVLTVAMKGAWSGPLGNYTFDVVTTGLPTGRMLPPLILTLMMLLRTSIWLLGIRRDAVR